MKYFFDTEFLEGRQWVKKFGIKLYKTKSFLDLISIGIVDDKNRNYYAVSNEFNLDLAWNDLWIREYVLKPICEGGGVGYSKLELKFYLKNEGKTRKQIAFEILQFIHDPDGVFWNEFVGTSGEYYQILFDTPKETSFWAYCGTSDWTCLYRLFCDKLIHRPKCFRVGFDELKTHMYSRGFSKVMRDEFCPKPEKEHIAIVDAEWNRRLYYAISRYGNFINRRRDKFRKP